MPYNRDPPRNNNPYIDFPSEDRAPPPSNNNPYAGHFPADNSLHGGVLDSAEQRAARREAAERFGGWWSGTNQPGIGGMRRFTAGARNFVSGIPFVGRGSFANPQIGTQERADLDLYRNVNPGHSFAGRILGSAAGYVPLGYSVPGMFSTPFRSGLTGATIEGADTALGRRRGAEDRSAILAALLGGAGGVIGGVPGRLITPRTPHQVQEFERRGIRDLGAVERGADISFLRHRTPSLFNSEHPMAQNIVTALAGGTYLGQHPALSAVAGLTPSLLAAIRTAERRGELSNQARQFGRGNFARIESEIGRQINPLERALATYSGNQLLTPGNQALLNALSQGIIHGSGVEETIAEALNNRYPNTLTGQR